MSGTVTFNIIPPNLRVPNVYFEVDASQANTGTINQRTLIIGQMLPTGTAINRVPLFSTGVGDAKESCGVGSMLANMLATYRAADAYGEVYLLPLLDGAGTTAAISKLTVSGTSTEPGTIFLYIAGSQVQIPVMNGDTAATIAANMSKMINTYVDLPCTSTVASTQVTLTARNAGITAGDMDVRLNYYGKKDSEFLPNGILIDISVTPGTGDIDPVNQLTAALANIPENMAFDFIVTPYTAAASLKAIESWLNEVSGRWSYVSEMFGAAWTAYRGTSATLTTWGRTNNSQYVSVLGFYDSPTPSYLVAADYAGTAAVSLRADPALPLQNIALHTMLAPPLKSRFAFGERQTLLYSGISTFKVADDGTVILERSCTTWQTNAAGAPDNAFLDTETIYTLMYVIRDLRTDLQTKFARKKLVADGTRIPYGVNFTTAQIVKGEVVANYRRNAALGMVQDPDQFAKDIVAENAGNGRVNVMAPFNIANQLRIIAVLAQFIKT